MPERGNGKMKITDKWTVDNQINATRIGVEDAERKLQFLTAWREEEKHTQELVNDIVDKFLDLGKLLIAISLPAMITVVTINESEFNTDMFLWALIILFVGGVILFRIAFQYKLKRLSPLIKSSTARLETINVAQETLRLYIKAQDSKNPIPK